MRTLWNFIKTTLAGGVFFLLPLLLIFMLLQKAIDQTAKLLKPVAHFLRLDAVIDLPGEKLAAVLFLLLIAFLAGLAAKTAAGMRLRQKLDAWLQKNVPGYSQLEKVVAKREEAGEPPRFVSAAVRLGEGWQPGFIVEESNQGPLTVFVPDAPSGQSGTVHRLPKERVFKLEVPPSTLRKCLKQWGTGTGELFGQAEKKDSVP